MHIFWSVSFLSLLVSKNQVGSSTCAATEDLITCELVVPKSPIWSVVMTVRSGLSERECLDTMTKFKWTEGVFCRDSLMCGLGFNFGIDYENKLAQELQPVEEVCQLIIRESRTTCDQLKSQLFASGILQERSCSVGGKVFCDQLYKNCEDIGQEVGFQCTECNAFSITLEDGTCDPMISYELSDWFLDECPCFCGNGRINARRTCKLFVGGFFEELITSSGDNPCGNAMLSELRWCSRRSCRVNRLTIKTLGEYGAGTSSWFQVSGTTESGDSCHIDSIHQYIGTGSLHSFTSFADCHACMTRTSETFANITVLIDSWFFDDWGIEFMEVDVNGNIATYKSNTWIGWNFGQVPPDELSGSVDFERT